MKFRVIGITKKNKNYRVFLEGQTRKNPHCKEGDAMYLHSIESLKTIYKYKFKTIGNALKKIKGQITVLNREMKITEGIPERDGDEEGITI